MLKKIFGFTALSVFVSVFAFISCTGAGLGEEVDLEAPVVSITTPQRYEYTDKNITLEGTCSDNKKVTRVKLEEVKSVGGQSVVSFLCNAEILPGNEWTANIDLEEGEKTIRVTACDAFNNSSVNSVQQITIFVDETAPEPYGWYINRGNDKYTTIQNLDYLKELDLEKSSSVDYPQNVSFTVKGSVYDAMSVKSVKLLIRVENPSPIDEDDTFINLLELENESETNYAPSWNITHSQLVNADPAYSSQLSSGISYLNIGVETVDNNNNKDTQDLGWFIWYPESDYPNFDRSIVDADAGVVLAHVNSAVTIDIFDDDELAYVYAGLITEAQYDALSGSSTDAKAKTLAGYSDSQLEALGMLKTTVSGSQISSVQAKTTGTPGAYYLAAFGCDSTSKTVKNAVLLDTYVSDDNVPILFVESPSENTIPQIDEGKTSQFSISGYSLDTSKTASVKIAFIPDGAYATNSLKRKAAQDILAADTTAAGSSKTLSDGSKVWNLTLTDAGTLTKGTTTWKKQTFKVTCDLLSDFNFNSALENKTKFFEFQVTDDDGNVVYQDFKMEGDTVEPDITPNHDDMYVCDYTATNLTLSFEASKTTGLGIDPDSCKITRIVSGQNGNTEVVLVDKGKTFTYTKAQLEEIAQSDSQPKFRFYANDLLGNKGVAQRTVVLTALPSLSKVTSDANDGTYKAGDKISITAEFTGPVKVTGSPRLSIKYSADDTTPKYAAYTSGSGTDTLKFSYTVPAGAKSSKIYCADNPIILNGGKIETTDANGGNAHLDSLTDGNRLQDFKNIAIDGVAPQISGLALSFKDSNDDVQTEGSLMAGKEIIAVLTCDKNVLVKGSPVLKLITGASTINCSFQGINGKTVTFTHKVTDTDVNGAVSYNKNQCFVSGDLENITDTNGNNLVLSSDDTTYASAIKIDTTAPSAPALSFTPGTLADGQKYNATQTLTLTGIESGATAQYSTDGGLSWNTYSAAVSLGTGKYKLTAKQTDAAGNVSALTAVKSVDINSQFPAVTDFACNAADKTYPKDSVLEFRLSFANKVKTTATTATLTLFNAGSGKTASVVASSGFTTSLTFKYTVQDGDNYTGLKVVSADLTGIVDEYGNTPASGAAAAILTEKGTRPNINLDAVAPSISSIVPKDSSGSPVIAQNGNVITITFSEDVYKGSGTFTLKRKGNWAIPAVMSATEFNSVYSQLSDEDKEILVAQTTTQGVKTDRLDARTGIAVGPYKKWTHGLKESSSKYVPDTETKYVLTFDLGLYSGTATLDKYASDGGVTADVSEIRKVFEKTGYHKQTLDVSSGLVVVADNVVTVTFPDELVDGREWEFTMDEGCFQDKIGNTCSAIEEGDCVFWSDKVAQPVVRVDRYSHGYGALEPGATATAALTEIKSNITARSTTLTDANAGTNIAPTGYCRTRIDCETPDAEIYYNTVAGGKVESTAIAFTRNYTNEDSAKSSIADIATSSLTLSSGGTKYTNYVIVGDGTYKNARKDYVVAYAKRSGFTQSENGREGVFKTAVYYIFNKNSTPLTYQINIEGGTAKGGMPNVSGFPLRDATSDIRYSKNAYKITSENAWAWVSYEIVTPWAILLHRTNYSSNYPEGNYGQIVYLYNYSNWEGDK